MQHIQFFFKKFNTDLLNIKSTFSNHNSTNVKFFNIKIFFYKNLKNLTLLSSNGEIKKNIINLILFNNTYFKFYYLNKINFFSNNFFNFHLFLQNFKLFTALVYKKTLGDGFIYIRGLLIIFFIDASITDDEPLWEPIEWSLVQTWIFFFFFFAWIAENLITSRYGSYTGRDKRVWFAWFKTFWLIEFWYIISFGSAILFVIVPFYYEITYTIAFVYSWWNWYCRIFFFKFISLFTIIIFISYFLLINIRYLNWKKLFLLILIVNIFLIYSLYTHFIMSFWGYFTDPLWYQKTRHVDLIQLSHEPLKWGWGPAKRDHYTYHKVSTVFWLKNDGPFASAFLLIHLFLFLSFFFLYLYWLILLRKIYTTKEVSFTYVTYCVSSLKQFLFFFLLIYIFIFISYLSSYWRFPIEFLWILNGHSWLHHFIDILIDYVLWLL